MISNKIRVGVIGLGYLGKFHYQKYKLNRSVNLTSVVDQQIENLNFTIDSLKLAALSKNNSNTVDFINLAKDAKIQFSDLESFGFSKMLNSTNFRAVDTVLVAKIRWKLSLGDSLRIQKSTDLKNWLEQELQEQRVEVLTH